MYKQNDEQTLIHTKVTLGKHQTKSLHLCQKQLSILHKFTHLNSIENKNSHRLWSVFFLRYTSSSFFSVIVNISCTLSI